MYSISKATVGRIRACKVSTACTRACGHYGSQYWEPDIWCTCRGAPTHIPVILSKRIGRGLVLFVLSVWPSPKNCIWRVRSTLGVSRGSARLPIEAQLRRRHLRVSPRGLTSLTSSTNQRRVGYTHHSQTPNCCLAEGRRKESFSCVWSNSSVQVSEDLIATYLSGQNLI